MSIKVLLYRSQSDAHNVAAELGYTDNIAYVVDGDAGEGTSADGVGSASVGGGCSESLGVHVECEESAMDVMSFMLACLFVSLQMKSTLSDTQKFQLLRNHFKLMRAARFYWHTKEKTENI